jgi:peroxiredoxin
MIRFNGKRLRWTALLLVMGVSLSLAGDAGGPAPEFTLNARDGKEVKLSQLRGQVVMLNFWASWCVPCREEMPLLEQMHKKYKGLGFTLVGVNVDKDSALAEGILKATPVSFPVLLDPSSKVAKLYNVATMPSSVIIDRKGQIRYVHRGYRAGDENTYLTQIRSLVKEK